MSLCVEIRDDHELTICTEIINVWSRSGSVYVCNIVLKNLAEIMPNQKCFNIVCEPITWDKIFLEFDFLFG